MYSIEYIPKKAKKALYKAIWKKRHITEPIFHKNTKMPINPLFKRVFAKWQKNGDFESEKRYI